MSPVATPAVSQPSFIKMEDRKRSAAQDDFAPPTKRQAVNGSKGSADSDLPWAKDLEVSRSHDNQASPSNLAIFYPKFRPDPYLHWRMELLITPDTSTRYIWLVLMPGLLSIAFLICKLPSSQTLHISQNLVPLQ